jgi:hypothetical protein
MGEGEFFALGKSERPGSLSDFPMQPVFKCWVRKKTSFTEIFLTTGQKSSVIVPNDAWENGQT